jgi:DNA-binding NarL/FixJ family response regulator
VLRIADAALLDRLAAILADDVDLVVETDDNADVVITDQPFFDRGLPTIILSDPAIAPKALRDGATAVLPQGCNAGDLLVAIEAAARGFVLAPRGRQDLLPASDRTSSHGSPALTPRELEVLRLLGQGASNKLIARHLDISVHTAKFHVASIMAKLDAIGRTDAVAQAVRLGLIML